MKVYIAAPWAHRGEAAIAGDKFEASGHTLTHRWWLLEGDDRVTLAACASKDFRAVIEADVLVVLHSAISEGKAVEQGIALACYKPIWLVTGLIEHPRHVFSNLPQYQIVTFVEDVIGQLRCDR